MWAKKRLPRTKLKEEPMHEAIDRRLFLGAGASTLTALALPALGFTERH